MDWRTLWSTFGLLFLAELGDKTQLAVITQTCRYRRPWAIFAGATAALAVVTALGVLAGQVADWLIPDRRIINWVAAAGFIVMGGLLAWEAWRSRGQEGPACEEEKRRADCSSWRVFGSTFALLALAELGDKTQLAAFARSSQTGQPWSVLIGAVAALATVTGLGVVGGQGLVRLIPERILRRVAAAAFIVMGVLIAAGVL